MADPLEEKMKQFVEDLKRALPTELVIREDIDVPALQRALEAEIETAFQKKYQAVDEDISKRIGQFDAVTKAKMGEIRDFQGKQQGQVQSLLSDLNAKQQQQQKLVQEIRELAERKKTEIAASQTALNEHISNLQTQMQEMSAQVAQMEAAFAAKGLKAEISEFQPLGRGKIQVTVRNLKWYSLEHLKLRFTPLKQDPSQPVCSDELNTPTEEPIVLGYAVVIMKGVLPQLQPQQKYFVTLELNQAIISNPLELSL